MASKTKAALPKGIIRALSPTNGFLYTADNLLLPFSANAFEPGEQLKMRGDLSVYLKAGESVYYVSHPGKDPTTPEITAVFLHFEPLQSNGYDVGVVDFLKRNSGNIWSPKIGNIAFTPDGDSFMIGDRVQFRVKCSGTGDLIAYDYNFIEINEGQSNISTQPTGSQDLSLTAASQAGGAQLPSILRPSQVQYLPFQQAITSGGNSFAQGAYEDMNAHLHNIHVGPSQTNPHYSGASSSAGMFNSRYTLPRNDSTSSSGSSIDDNTLVQDITEVNRRFAVAQLQATSAFAILTHNNRTDTNMPRQQPLASSIENNSGRINQMSNSSNYQNPQETSSNRDWQAHQQKIEVVQRSSSQPKKKDEPSSLRRPVEPSDRDISGRSLSPQSTINQLLLEPQRGLLPFNVAKAKTDSGLGLLTSVYAKYLFLWTYPMGLRFVHIDHLKNLYGPAQILHPYYKSLQVVKYVSEFQEDRKHCRDPFSIRQLTVINEEFPYWQYLHVCEAVVTDYPRNSTGISLRARDFGRVFMHRHAYPVFVDDIKAVLPLHSRINVIITEDHKALYPSHKWVAIFCAPTNIKCREDLISFSQAASNNDSVFSGLGSGDPVLTML